MAIIRWLGENDVYSQLDKMRNEMERWFGNFGTRPYQRTGVYPLMNVYDDGESFIVRAELPGVDPKDLDISVTGDTLTLKGERKPAEVPEGASYHRRELSTGTFRRALTLADQVDSSKVVANYKDGILDILLPRAEQAKLRKVEVKSS
jgi:HSP20 family protein